MRRCSKSSKIMQFLLYVIVAGLSMITRMSLRINRGGRRGIKAGFLPTEIRLGRNFMNGFCMESKLASGDRTGIKVNITFFNRGLVVLWSIIFYKKKGGQICKIDF